MNIKNVLLAFLTFFFLGAPSHTYALDLGLQSFLTSYLQKSPEVLRAQRQFANAIRTRDQQTDLWQSRIEATNELSFEDQTFESGLRDDNSNRTSNSSARWTQQLPTGTAVEVSAQKFWEIQNPLSSSLDRGYSARITQDLFRNAFGKTQQAQKKQAHLDFELASLELRRSMVASCETAFNLYTDAYIQQEIAALLKTQFEDAKRAVGISRQLFRDKLINQIDKLTSESDFINTRLQFEQAEQAFRNSQLQIVAFLKRNPNEDFQLFDPAGYFTPTTSLVTDPTLDQIIVEKRIASQDLDVEQARSERWTDVQFGIEAGERFGRLNFGGPLINYNEEYLTANLSFGFDLINKTEDARLRNAITVKNNLAVETQTLQKTQKNKLAGLFAMDRLLKAQVKTSASQSKMLKDKMNIAFTQMKRARLDFQTYLLHRNAYLNQQQNYLRLKQDLWLNQFAIQKEFAHTHPKLCEVPS